MREAEYYGQLLDQLLDEINVREFRVRLTDAERGPRTMTYNRKSRRFFLKIGDADPKPAGDGAVADAMRLVYAPKT